MLLKGVNRHSFWPDSGRTTSRAVSEMDVKLIKDMNMNAVRMSHYPPDRHFLEACDELGLFVLDELTGWQHPLRHRVGRKLVRELVVRDVNHPGRSSGTTATRAAGTTTSWAISPSTTRSSVR